MKTTTHHAGNGTLTFTSRFDDVEKAVKSATQDGMDETMALCVQRAKGTVRVDTAALQGSIMFKPAHYEGNTLVAEWGSYGIEYAIYQEIGPVSGSRSWAFTPYLRPARDAEYPSIVQRIAKRMVGK
jgi:hypothetical protein